MFYPAPGYRHPYYGTLFYVGHSGYSWASSVTTGTTAYYLGFNYDSVRPNNSSGHAYGLPLRCLQE